MHKIKYVVRLEDKGFEIDPYLKKIEDEEAEPLRELEVKREYVIVRFPDNNSLAKTAKEIGGDDWSKWAPINTREFRWPREDEEKVRRVFAGFVGNERPAIEITRPDKIDPQKALAQLGDLSREMPNGWTLYEHQQDSVRRVLETPYHGRVLALDFGVGKSFCSAVTAMGLQKEFDLDVVVLTPASLKENWARELDRLVENPIILSDHHSKIPDTHEKPFVLIADEAHRLAGHSQRGDAFVSLSQQAVFALPLTGAPVRHGQPGTSYNLLKAIGHPLAEMNRDVFDARFNGFEADVEQFWQQTNQDIIRKKKDECLDLPPKTRIVRQVDVTQADVHRYEVYFEKAKKKFWDAVKAGKKEARFYNAGLVHYVRQAASLGKVRTATEIAEEVVLQDRQIVLFCFYKNSAHALRQQLEHLGVAFITGDTPMKDRQPLVDQFQAGHRKVAILSWGAAGFGVTLTAADTIVLVDRPMTVEPQDVLNGEDRINRIGQISNVTSVWLQFDHPTLRSPDKRLDGMIIGKHRLNELAMAGEPEELAFADGLGNYMANWMFNN